jgi:1-acyl-sn-glycerol-3-phosphate acyltransferase
MRRDKDASRASVEAEITRLSANEMVDALALGRAPGWVRSAARAIFTLPSRPLARGLARFDRRIVEVGLPAAATEALAAFGARLSVRWDGPPDAEDPARAETQPARGQARPARAGGPLLVVANHPGAYDAMALMAALDRRDLAIIAADRSFLRALPSMSRHLVFVPADDAGESNAPARAGGLRRAVRHLRQGGALLHFPAGQIEPDPAFQADIEEPRPAWQPGTGALVRAAAAAGGRVAVAIVAGVHSARAKRLLVTRLAERRGVTTLAPLIQIALPGFKDVDVRVRVGVANPAADLARGAADDAEITERLRGRAAALVDAIPQRA